MANSIHQNIPIRAVIGLGNPGRNYENTRHNVGFKVIDLILKDIAESKIKYASERESIIASVQILRRKVFFVKPLSYMNLSGNVVARLLKKEDINVEEILVVHDDMDIELGRIKLKIGGGAAGHNGVESVIFSLGTEKFARLRIGIGREKNRPMHEYVLSEFKDEEKTIIQKSLELSADAVRLTIRRDFVTAMNKYNVVYPLLNKNSN